MRTVYVQRPFVGIGGGPFEDRMIDILFPRGAKIVFVEMSSYGLPIPIAGDIYEVFMELSRQSRGILDSATGSAGEDYGSVVCVANVTQYYGSNPDQDQAFNFSENPLIFGKDTHLYLNGYKNYANVQGHVSLVLHYYEEK